MKDYISRTLTLEEKFIIEGGTEETLRVFRERDSEGNVSITIEFHPWNMRISFNDNATCDHRAMTLLAMLRQIVEHPCEVPSTECVSGTVGFPFSTDCSSCA